MSAVETITAAPLTDYRFALVNRMSANPWRINEAVTGKTFWFLSTEELSALCDLEEQAEAALDAGGLSPTRQAELSAALTAIAHRRQLLDDGCAKW